MSLNNFKSVIMLAEEKHFVRAAARLGISQSALTQQIQKIERELGFTLFTRSQRQVNATEAGRVFVEEAALVIRQYEAAVGAARSAAKGAIGRLRLGFVENAALHMLPRTASIFHKQFPLVQLELTEMNSEELEEAILEGFIDAAFLRPLHQNSSLQSLTLLREPYLVALSQDHPLASKKIVALNDLASQGMIIASGSKAKYIRSVFRPIFERLGIELIVAQEVNQLHAIIGLVGSGLGYTLLPKSATALQIEGVVYRPIEEQDTPYAELKLAWLAENKNPVLANFTAVTRRLINH